jgi:hypothetical protein
MKARALPLVTFILVVLTSSDCGMAQSVSSSGNGGAAAVLPFAKLTASSPAMPRTFSAIFAVWHRAVRRCWGDRVECSHGGGEEIQPSRGI